MSYTCHISGSYSKILVVPHFSLQAGEHVVSVLSGYAIYVVYLVYGVIKLART